ncbi:putative SP-containing protein [Vairimorpha necatrix]|uniref:SP-containing protein n=1 Tax=Vairimorpha necatrix TaxID=6039 RepID=A0AAX4JC88_9MICR
MNIVQILLFINFLQASDLIYDKLNITLLNKIVRRDYSIINIENRYLKVILNLDLSLYEINAKLTMVTYPWNKNEELEEITIAIDDKSIKSIVEEFEGKLLIEYIKHLADAIILIYDPKYCKDNQTYQKIIKYLKEENLKRKEMDMRPEIYYDIIIDHCGLWNRTIIQIACDLKYFKSSSNTYKIPIMITEINSECYLNLSIQTDNIFYLFEVDLNEVYEKSLLSSVSFISSHTNDTDIRIGKHFHELYKFMLIDESDLYIQHRFEVFKFNEIKLINGTFEIKIYNNEIRIMQDQDCFVYSTRKRLIPISNEINIEEKSLLEFRNLFKKIYVIEQNDEYVKAVELFYRLLRHKKKLGFLVGKIINNPGTAINIIFAHLLLSQKIISENEIKIILGSEKLDKMRKKQLISQFLKKTDNQKYSSNIYIMKICIFLEAEKYINNNNNIDDPIFNSLKHLGKLVVSRKNTRNNINNSSYDDSTDLLEINQEFLKHHLKDITNHKDYILTLFLELSSLFTGFEENTYVLRSNHFYNLKREVVNNFGLNESTIENNIKIIKKEITKNSQEDAEKIEFQYFNRLEKNLEENRKKTSSEIEINLYKGKINGILRKLTKSIFNKLFNEIMNDVYSLEIDDLYDEEVKLNFEETYIEIGKNKIEKTFQYNKTTFNTS